MNKAVTERVTFGATNTLYLNLNLKVGNKKKAKQCHLVVTQHGCNPEHPFTHLLQEKKNSHKNVISHCHHSEMIIELFIRFIMIKTGFASCEWGILTRAEGVHVLVELEPHHWTIVVNNVGLAVPGTRDHLLSAVSLQTNTGKRETCMSITHHFRKWIFIHSYRNQQLCSYYLAPPLQNGLRYSLGYCDQ